MDSDQFKQRIAQIFSALDQYTYYELLNLKPDASPSDIQQAFHRMALSMHPDRFANHPDEALREQVYAVYKRITEGYRVLSKDDTRKRYSDALQRGENRLVEIERPRVGPKPAADKIDNPAARRFFQMGQDAERRGDKKTARTNYKFAKDLVGDHPLINAHLQALEEDPK